MVDPRHAHCAAHPEHAAATACFRCGTFACEACSPRPSILCADCVARLPASDVARWDQVPPPPSALRAWLRATAAVVLPFVPLLSVFLGALLGLPLRATALSASAVLVVAIVVRIARLSRNELLRAVLGGRRRLGEGRPREAAVLLEEALRRREGTAALRTIALVTFASAVTHGSGEPRALPIPEAVLARGWRGDVEAIARIVAVGALARAQRFDDADAMRKGVRLSWRARRRATLADTDGLLAARRGADREAHEQLRVATAWARRRRFPAIAAWTALLDAFVLDRSGASESEVEAALVIARAARPESIAGLTHGWPELADFVARHLPSAEQATVASPSA